MLVAFALFLASMLFAPNRGVLAAALRFRRFRLRVHERQGLLAVGRGERIYDGLTLRVLTRAGLIRPDGVATEAGQAQAAKALWDERRWQEARQVYRNEAVAGRYDGLTPIEAVLTPDEIADLDRRIGRPAPVEG